VLDKKLAEIERRKSQLTPAILDSGCQRRRSSYTYTEVRESLPACLPPAQVTALHMACWSGQREVVDILLERGADPNSLVTITPDGGSQWQFSPLYLAARHSQPGICRALLARGARQDLGDWGPMEDAATEEIRQILRGR
jgi:hypothetical protein